MHSVFGIYFEMILLWCCSVSFGENCELVMSHIFYSVCRCLCFLSFLTLWSEKKNYLSVIKICNSNRHFVLDSVRVTFTTLRIWNEICSVQMNLVWVENMFDIALIIFPFSIGPCLWYRSCSSFWTGRRVCFNHLANNTLGSLTVGTLFRTSSFLCKTSSSQIGNTFSKDTMFNCRKETCLSPFGKDLLW